MIEYSVKIWSMILTGYKVLDPALFGGSVPDLVSEIYVRFPFYVTFQKL